MKNILFGLLMMLGLFAWASGPIEQFNLAASTSQFAFSATTTSQMVLGVNLSRGYLAIQNSCSSTDLIRVTLRAAEASSNGIEIQPCGLYEFTKVPTNSIWIVSASGTQTAKIVEGNAQ